MRDQAQAEGKVTRIRCQSKPGKRTNVISLRKMRHFFNRTQETATAAGTE
ncbi:MAG: hypothetical protein OXE78_02285 [Gammaproteobacteria bacterium]|nr:hypothetical protein [Gammaproteobacteria bacterium]